MRRENIFKLAFFILICLTACKKDDNSPEPTPIPTPPSFSIKPIGSFEELFLGTTDTIDLVLEAKGKKYSVEYLGEKRVYYPYYDSTMLTCSMPVLNAFYLVEAPEKFELAADQKSVYKLVFAPNNFTFEITEFTIFCINGGCYPQPNCKFQISNGVGNYKSLLQFKIDGKIKSIEITATSKATGGKNNNL